MKIDLSSLAGFPLSLDSEKMNMDTGEGILFAKKARTKAQMKSVLMEPDKIQDNTKLYFNFDLVNAGPEVQAFQQNHMTFTCVLLPPMKIGCEYVKTHGHYHPLIPGTQIIYPEIYTHFYGQLYLLMQRRNGKESDCLNDCVIYKMKPGRSILVPPGYLHVLINPSDEPALMGGLFCIDSLPDYDPAVQMAGAAYYLIEKDHREEFIRNPRYRVCPPIRWLDDPLEDRFSPPRQDRPLWKSFIEEPQVYSFINNPAAATYYFQKEKAHFG